MREPTQNRLHRGDDILAMTKALNAFLLEKSPMAEDTQATKNRRSPVELGIAPDPRLIQLQGWLGRIVHIIVESLK